MGNRVMAETATAVSESSPAVGGAAADGVGAAASAEAGAAEDVAGVDEDGLAWQAARRKANSKMMMNCFMDGSFYIMDLILEEGRAR